MFCVVSGCPRARAALSATSSSVLRGGPRRMTPNATPSSTTATTPTRRYYKQQQQRSVPQIPHEQFEESPSREFHEMVARLRAETKAEDHEEAADTKRELEKELATPPDAEWLRASFPFQAHSLPFQYFDYNPMMGEELREHLEEHYVPAVAALNRCLNSHEGYQDHTLEDLIRANVGELTDLAANVANHSLFFHSIHPSPEYRFPSGFLANLIDKNFGSLPAMKRKFNAAATNLVGSGWCFLAYTPKDQRMHIITSSDYGNPLQFGMQPLIVADMFEHAYYPQYRDDVDHYLADFWRHMDWKRLATLVGRYGEKEKDLPSLWAMDEKAK